jgi:hypothetical protein
MAVGTWSALIERFRPEAAFTGSEAERRFLELCRRHGLPPPQANLWIAPHDIDFFWPDARLAVEIDGGPTTAARARSMPIAGGTGHCLRSE